VLIRHYVQAPTKHIFSSLHIHFTGHTIGQWLLNALHSSPSTEVVNTASTACMVSDDDAKSTTSVADDEVVMMKQGARNWRDSKLWQPHAALLRRERIHQELIRKRSDGHDAAYPSFLYLIAGTIETNSKNKRMVSDSAITQRVVSYVGASFNPMLSVKQHNLVSRCNANRQKRVTNWRLVIFTGPLSREHILLWRDVWRSKRGVQSRLDLILQFALWSSAWLFGPSSMVLRAQIQQHTLHLFHFLQTKRGTPEFIDWYESFRRVIEDD
jgi:hypothetical protein